MGRRDFLGRAQDLLGSGAPGGGLPAGSSMGQLLVWDQTAQLWVPTTNTDAREPALYRFSATSGGDFQARAAAIALGFSSAGLLSLADYGFTAHGTFKHAVVATADATVTTLLSVPMSDGLTHTILALTTADQVGGASSAGYIRAATVKRTGGGVATLVGGVTAIHTAEDVAGFDNTLDVDGANSWRNRVTGAAATNLSWRCIVLYGQATG